MRRADRTLSVGGRIFDKEEALTVYHAKAWSAAALGEERTNYEKREIHEKGKKKRERTEMNTPVLEIVEMDLVLRGRVVLRNFSMEVRGNDFVALTGANGSGKTSLLKTITGVNRVLGGSIRIFGELTHGIPSRHVRSRIGYVPQSGASPQQCPLSVRDVVSIGRFGRAGIGRRLSRTDRITIDRAIEEVGIVQLANRPVGQLSGGEHQKVQIARALCQDPEILLLDEPTSNLDLGAQHEFLDLTCRICEERRLATILVMHDINQIPGSCNRAVIIDDGTKMYDGDFEGLFTEENLSHIYKHRTRRVMEELMNDVRHAGRKR